MNRDLAAWIDRWWWPLLALGVGLHLTTLFGAIAEVDSALYATVARHMAETGDFINLIAYRQEWLDKPHFPFWVTALSFKAFGINEVAYRIPALGFVFLGAHYTWRLGVLLFDRTVARLAVLLLLTSEHLVLSNADVRAEPFLVGLVIAAVFHLVCARRERWLGHLVAGAAFTAAAMMTKGPFLLMPIGGALVAHDWRALLKGRWLLAALLVFVFLLPELVSLYLQFDARPELVMFGRTGVSGVRFFFWDSQFGRFLNTGPIRGSGDPTYFFHVVLWAFLPWSLWLYVAVGTRVRAVWKSRGPERHVWGAAVPTLLLFSASRFQLPHYLNFLFPFFALMVAAWLAQLESPRARGWATGLGLAVSGGMPVAAAGLLMVVDVPGRAWVVTALLGTVGAGFLLFRKLTVEATVGRAFVAAVAVNLALILSYQPVLLRYQVGREAAALANTLPPMQTALMEVESLPFDFHLREPVVRWTADDTRKMTEQGPARVLMSAGGKAALEERGLTVKVLGTWDYFHVSMATRTFLDARTRSTVVEPWVLAEVRGPGR